MNLWMIFALAVGLAMDAFAVSVASGIAMRNFRIGHAFRMAAAFGLFQSVMPLFGWVAGRILQHAMEDMDHWIAFILLGFIGGKMIYEATRLEKAEEPTNPFALRTLLILAVATSIDAFAVGVTFAMIGAAIVAPVLIIGAVTFALCLAGVYIGERVGHFFEKKIEIAGGLVLIAIGFKILFDHLLK